MEQSSTESEQDISDGKFAHTHLYWVYAMKLKFRLSKSCDRDQHRAGERYSKKHFVKNDFQPEPITRTSTRDNPFDLGLKQRLDKLFKQHLKEHISLPLGNLKIGVGFVKNDKHMVTRRQMTGKYAFTYNNGLLPL